MKGSTKLHIRTATDVLDVWNFVKKGEQILLWCQGNLQEVSDNDSDEEMLKRPPVKKKRLSVLEEKNNRIDSTLIIINLKEKDGS